MSAGSIYPSSRREMKTSSYFSPSGELARSLESNSRRRHTTEKMPTEYELEDFFAAAEKNLQKQFIEKYNFDIVKDEPLEGRYEWVPIQLKQ